MAHINAIPLTAGEAEERMRRLAAAVALVERGDSRGHKVSVRRAAALYGVPKSTVHRHIQVNRGVDFQRRGRVTRPNRPSSPGLHKLTIGFLVNNDSDTESTTSSGATSVISSASSCTSLPSDIELPTLPPLLPLHFSMHA